MAKPRRAKQPGQLTRNLVVRDPRLISPQFVDFSMLALGADVVIHSMFQTEIPVVEPSDLKASGKIDSALVGRFVYPGDYFKALTVMFMRQYIAFEQNRDKKAEAVAWLKQELQLVETGGSPTAPEASPQD